MFFIRTCVSELKVQELNLKEANALFAANNPEFCRLASSYAGVYIPIAHIRTFEAKE